MHKKLSEMPTEWPVARKGRTYIARASHDGNKSVPVVFALRDILKLAGTRREVKKLCLEGSVKVNGKVRKDIVFPVQARDVLTLDKIGKSYLLVLKNKRFVFEEVKGTKADRKIVKVIGKITLGKNKLQANLQDGRNCLMSKDFSCGDSVLIEFDKKGVSKVIPLKEGSKIEVIKGRHIGQEGKIVGTKKEGDKLTFEINLEDGRMVVLDKKVLLAIE